MSLSESRFVDREVDIQLGSPKGRRDIYLGGDAQTADVATERLGREQTLQGPCITEERDNDSNLPNWRATVAKDGAVVAERMEGVNGRYRARVNVGSFNQKLVSKPRRLSAQRSRPIVREAGDLATALFDANARMARAGVDWDARAHKLS